MRPRLSGPSPGLRFWSPPVTPQAPSGQHLAPCHSHMAASASPKERHSERAQGPYTPPNVHGSWAGCPRWVVETSAGLSFQDSQQIEPVLEGELSCVTAQSPQHCPLPRDPTPTPAVKSSTLITYRCEPQIRNVCLFKRAKQEAGAMAQRVHG